MTIYYVDPAGSNTSPYNTWIKAATQLATVVAIPPAATDVIYCRGTETISAEIDLASSGANNTGWIKVIGCNSGGTVDGTRYVINCGGNDINGIDFGGFDMWWFENIEVCSNGAGGKHGIYNSSSGSDGHVFINCCIHNMSGTGFHLAAIRYSTFIRCVSYLNTLQGFLSGGTNGGFYFCCARENTTDGFNAIQGSDVMYGCISHGNTDDGIGGLLPLARIFNCVIDNNTDDGIELGTGTTLYTPVIVGTRITNHSGANDNGIYLGGGEPLIVGWSYFEDNTDNINDHTSVLFQFIPNADDTTTNLEDLANTNEGYAAAIASHNFATNYVDSGDPDLRRVAITIPWS